MRRGLVARVALTYATTTSAIPGDIWDTGEVFLCDTARGTTVQITDSERASFNPAVSGDGRYVVFTSQATDLVPGDTNGVADVFLWSRRTGTIRRLTDLADYDAQEVYPPDPLISDDGRVVVFHVFPDQAAWASGRDDVFRWDRTTGETVRISDRRNYNMPAMSADGRVVAFVGPNADGTRTDI